MSNFQIKNLSFAYEDGEKTILNEIDLEIKPGEFVCLLGKSGCGKSTLLRIFAGLLFPTSGEILFEGAKIENASLERSVVFQDYGLFPWMTVSENILIALKQKYKSKNKNELREIAKDSLRKVGLEENIFNKLPKQLSGGMQQRVAIAQAISVNPKVLLMDEPFGALDAVTRAKLQDLVIDLWNESEIKKTVLFVTHDVDEAIYLANRIIVLGQSPSKIIYDKKMIKAKCFNRDFQYKDEKIFEIRNELITVINQDVAEHAASID